MSFRRIVSLCFGLAVLFAACGSPAEWTAFEDPDYSIDFPGTPKQDLSSAQGILFELQTVETDDVAYSAGKFDAPQYDLETGLNGAFQTGLATTPTNVEDLTVDGHNCKKGFGSGTAQGVEAQNSVLVCYDGTTGYILQVISEAGDDVDPDRFFNSFSIKN